MSNKEQLDKQEKILAMQEKISKKYGDGALIRYGSAERVAVDVIPTGVMTLDYALGCGGIPRGRIIEIYGGEQASKSTMASVIVAQAQKNGGMAAYIDAEHALDMSYLKNLGVDIDNLYLSQPNSGEEALDILEKVVQSNAFDVAVVDSVAALVSQAELAGDIGDAHIALQARLMSHALRKLTAIIDNSKTAVIFINQTRQNISTTGYGGAGEVTTGGKALKFYASMRIELRKTEWIRKSEEVIGQKVKVKIVKNKLAPPFKVVDLELLFGKGYSTEGMLIDLAMNAGLITRNGAWFYYLGNRIAQGKEGVRKYLQENSELASKLENQVLEFIKTGKVELPTERTGDEDVN